MMSIAAKEKEIIEEFDMFNDWTDKYEYIIELGKELPLIDPRYKTEDHLIRGCQSQVWLQAEKKDSEIIYTADSDAIITRGIIAMLIKVLSHEKPEAIVEADLSFIDRIGLKEHLSPTRSNGLVSMIRQMKMYALALQAKTT